MLRPRQVVETWPPWKKAVRIRSRLASQQSRRLTGNAGESPRGCWFGPGTGSQGAAMRPCRMTLRSTRKKGARLGTARRVEPSGVNSSTVQARKGNPGKESRSRVLKEADRSRTR